jgi:hypothetical protein
VEGEGKDLGFGGSIGFEFARGMRVKLRGEYRVSSLVKQKIKGKNYAVFCFAGKKIIILYLCCDCEANFL